MHGQPQQSHRQPAAPSSSNHRETNGGGGSGLDKEAILNLIEERDQPRHTHSHNQSNKHHSNNHSHHTNETSASITNTNNGRNVHTPILENDNEDEGRTFKLPEITPATTSLSIKKNNESSSNNNNGHHQNGTNNMTVNHNNSASTSNNNFANNNSSVSRRRTASNIRSSASTTKHQGNRTPLIHSFAQQNADHSAAAALIGSANNSIDDSNIHDQSFEQYNPQHSSSGSKLSTMLSKIKKERKESDEGVMILSNRIRLLKKEEVKTNQKIDEMRKKSEHMLFVKQRHENHVAIRELCHRDHQQRVQTAQIENETQRALDKQKRKEQQEDIFTKNHEIHEQTKKERNQAKADLNERLTRVHDEHSEMIHQMRKRKKAALRKMHDDRYGEQNYADRFAAEMNKERSRLESNEKQLISMESEEQNLIKKLQKSQMIHNNVYNRLQDAIHLNPRESAIKKINQLQLEMSKLETPKTNNDSGLFLSNHGTAISGNRSSKSTSIRTGIATPAAAAAGNSSEQLSDSKTTAPKRFHLPEMLLKTKKHPSKDEKSYDNLGHHQSMQAQMNQTHTSTPKPAENKSALVQTAAFNQPSQQYVGGSAAVNENNQTRRHHETESSKRNHTGASATRVQNTSFNIDPDESGNISLGVVGTEPRQKKKKSKKSKKHRSLSTKDNSIGVAGKQHSNSGSNQALHYAQFQTYTTTIPRLSSHSKKLSALLLKQGLYPHQKPDMVFN